MMLQCGVVKQGFAGLLGMPMAQARKQIPISWIDKHGVPIQRMGRLSKF